MSDDPLREMRTMVLVALPYPPLPVEVHKLSVDDGTIIDNETDEYKVASTHDIISVCINACVQKDDKQFNEQRRQKQTIVMQDFLRNLATGGFELEGEDLYHFYCDYSYRHIASYFHDNDKPELRFKPYAFININDEFHKKLVEHYLAHKIVIDSEDTDVKPDENARQEHKKNKEKLANQSVGSILKKYRKLIGYSKPLSDL
jgi:hypothetical protein